MTQQSQESEIDEFICVDPEIGIEKLSAYLADTIQNEHKQDFEHHLPLCRKCQEELEYVQWVLRQTREHQENIITEVLFRKHLNVPLPVTSVRDRNHQELSDEYAGKPLRERLAASSDTTGNIAFPYLVQYAGGRITGEFLKRVGQLFFRLKNSTIGKETFWGRLVYTSPTTPSRVKTFDLREGEDTRLGAFHEFVPSDTIQDMLQAISHFQLFLKRDDDIR